MKKLFLLALLGFCAMTTTTSCSSDDDQPIIENPDPNDPGNGDENGDNDNNEEAQNFFSLNGEEYPLKTGSLDFWGEEEEGVYAWDISLFSSNFTFNFQNEDFPFEFDDDLVSSILIELNTDTSQGLQVGIYQIDEDNFTPFVCSYFDILLQCDYSDLEADEEEACEGFYFIESIGTVEVVSIEDEVYELKIEGETEEGFDFEAHYKGELLDLESVFGRPSKEIESNKKFNRKQRRK